MCGIVGVLAHGAFETKKEEKIRQEAMIFLTTELLQLTQARGKDATGVATLFNDGDYMGLKMGVSAQEFVTRFGNKETDYEGFLNIWRKKTKPASIVIGHCRKPSTAVGAGTEDNSNNHPIKVGDIVGIHNGTLTNHDNIFTNLKCDKNSKVDSEAIFRLIDHLTNNGSDPFTSEMIQEVCRRLAGTYSCLAFNGNNPYQLVGFRDGRPMVFGLIKPLKLFLIASEQDYLKVAISRYNKMSFLYQLGANKFPGLRKGDVEFGTTIDDSMFMFDTTKEVTGETKLTDLYVTEKVPRNNKLWSKSTTTNVWNSNRHYNNIGNAAQTTGAGAAGAKKTGTEVTAGKPGAPGDAHQGSQAQGTAQTDTSTGKKGTSNTHRIGMAWNHTSNMYEDVSGAKKTVEEHGAVLIDIDQGSVKDIKTGAVLEEGEKKVAKQVSHNGGEHTMQRPGSQRLFELAESIRPVDDLITDPAKITTANVSDIGGNGRGDIPACVGTGIYAVHKGGKTTMIDPDLLRVDGEIFEKALVATEEVGSFSNDEETADALEILDTSAMREMPVYSLANRIKKFFFKKGWYMGYLACEVEHRLVAGKTPNNSVDVYARTMLERMRTGKHRSAASIRAIKVLIGIIADATGHGLASRENVTQQVVKAIEDGKEMNPDALEKVFRPGDMKKHPVIGTAIATMRHLGVGGNSNGKTKTDSSSV